MRVFPSLLSARKRLLGAALLSLAFATFSILLVCSNSFWDPGILWHTESQRNATLHDRHVLLISLFAMEALTALLVGGSFSIGGASLAADTARARFLLTRPSSRSSFSSLPSSWR